MKRIIHLNKPRERPTEQDFRVALYKINDIIKQVDELYDYLKEKTDCKLYSLAGAWFSLINLRADIREYAHEKGYKDISEVVK